MKAVLNPKKDKLPPGMEKYYEFNFKTGCFHLKREYISEQNKDLFKGLF